MKSLYILLLVGVVLLTGCDPVASDNRLIEVPAATLQRNVLIEDFTGQRCIFCPAATEAITQLQARYSADKLIACAQMWEMLIIRSGKFPTCQKQLSIVEAVCFPKKHGRDKSIMSLLGQQQ